MPLKTIQVEQETKPTLKGFTATMDPSDHYGPKGAKVGKLWDAMGLIPYFISEAAQEPTAKTVMDHMVDTYGWGMGSYNMLGEDQAGKLEGDVYKYPEDEDLYPYARFELLDSGVEIRVYPYALVAVTGPDGQFMQRFD